MREKAALSLLAEFFPDVDKEHSILDIGCGDGVFSNSMASRFKNSGIYGCDYSYGYLKKAKEQEDRIHAVQCNVEDGIPFESHTFDLVCMFEVLEHLYNPDLLLEEVHRVLKESGYLLLSTPNLCAWYNRVLFLLGIQPLFVETSVKWASVGAGPLRRFKKETYPVGHVRTFNFQALKDLLIVNGFKIVLKKGSVFERFPGPLLLFDQIFTYFPNLSSGFIVLAKKINKSHEDTGL